MTDSDEPFHVTDIKQHMDDRDMNQTDLSEAVGCTPQTISDLLNGRRKLSVEMAIKIAREFGYDPVGPMHGTPKAKVWLRHQLDSDYGEAIYEVRQEQRERGGE